MSSKRSGRREFLKRSAALAGGLTLGAAAPAMGQARPLDFRQIGTHSPRRQAFAR